jgi:hypothetical protein
MVYQAAPVKAPVETVWRVETMVLAHDVTAVPVN